MQDFLSENIVLVFALIVVLVIWNALLQMLVLKNKKRIAVFLKGKKIRNLDQVLTEQSNKIKGINEEIRQIHKHNDLLQKMCDISITKIGIVRFNPFGDTGGDQSFAIALLDKNNNGLVLSSLYSREGNRIFTKPIKNGLSPYNLTEEEKEAIAKAIKQP